ncbi:MAG: DUF1778 domain-containing protein [Polyangiaceae bacterium]|nr:DUF1778 domain-containing protein [Polyangiaceae bacterium]
MAPSWHHYGAMQLDPYVEAVQRQLAAAAETGGDQARALAAQLAATLESAVRLAVQDAVASAVSEITCELAPGAVELRLRGRDLEFVVIRRASDSPDRAEPKPLPLPPTPEVDQGAVDRINLRVPARLKMRIEAAATAAGLSVNAWLVRAAAQAAEQASEGAKGDARDEHGSYGGQRFKGWAR